MMPTPSKASSPPRNKGNILLVFPPLGFYQSKTSADWCIRSPRRGLQIGKNIVPPLGLLYLASILTDQGFGATFVDLMVEAYDTRRFAQLLTNQQAVGISMPSLASRHAVTQIVRDLRALNTEIPIVVGGVGITLAPEMIAGVDALVLGEAELVIAPLMDQLINRRACLDLRGVVYPDQAAGNQLATIPPSDLDALEFPARYLVEAKRYRAAFGMKCASLVTSRGCPFRCKFCVPALYADRQVRKRSVQNVLAEIQQIASEGYGWLEIVDQDFLSDKQRAAEICAGILERDIKLTITVQGRVDRADRDLYRLMRQAGVRIIYFGLESGNQDTLDFYARGTTVEHNRHAVQVADQCGLYTHGSFILGAPMETEQHLARTIAFAKTLPLDSASFNPLHYTRGSPLWAEAFQQGLVRRDEYDVIASRERGLGGIDDRKLNARGARGAREFYLRPAFVLAHLRKAVRLGDARFTLFLIGWLLGVLRDAVTDRLRNLSKQLS